MQVDDRLFCTAGEAPQINAIAISRGIDALLPVLAGRVADTACDFIHVWQFELDVCREYRGLMSRWLNDDEVERAARFRFDELRHRYRACHGLVRALLAAYAQVSPTDVSYTLAEYGKPTLAATMPGRRLEFNLSHSAGVGMLAISDRRVLGVDIELFRDNIGGLDIAKRFFSERESNWMAALPADLQQRAFFTSWVRKEAYIKALGKGLQQPLNSFEIRQDQSVSGRLVVHDNDSGGIDTAWQLRDLNSDTGSVAAIAYAALDGDDAPPESALRDDGLRHYRLQLPD